MRTLTLIIAFILISFISQAQTENKGKTITVTVKNIKNTNGKVILALHNSETFMTGKSGIQSSETSIIGDSIQVTYKNVIPGEYAIMGVHDENENKKMDFELNGMPKESYGMSNNPILYGPPTFNDAKFKVADENIDLVIRF